MDSLFLYLHLLLADALIVQLFLKEAIWFTLILTRELCMTVFMTFLIVALTWPIGSPSL